jgi:hypothetical protein
MDQEQMQELDRILKLWADSYQPNMDADLTGCHHDSKVYIGFSEEYEYCTKCDSKKIAGEWL